MSPPLRQEELTTPMAVELSKTKEKRLDDAWNSLEIQKQAYKYAHPGSPSFTGLQLDNGDSCVSPAQKQQPLYKDEDKYNSAMAPA